MTTHLNFCPNCGEELTTKTNFCPNCGYDLSHLNQSKNQSSNLSDQTHHVTHSAVLKAHNAISTSKHSEYAKQLWESIKTSEWTKMGLTGVVVFFIMLIIFTGFRNALTTLLGLGLLLIIIAALFIFLTDPNSQKVSIPNPRQNPSTPQAKVSKDSKTAKVAPTLTVTDSVYTIRIREFITVLGSLGVVATTYFGNFFTMQVPIIHSTVGMPLSGILNNLGYFSNNAKQLLLVLSVLPAIGIVLVIIPNIFARILSTIAIIASDAAIAYVIYKIYEYREVGDFLNVTPNISFFIMVIAAGLATLFSLFSLIPKTVERSL